MELEKSSIPASTRRLMAALVEKLNEIGGRGKLAEREWRIRCRLKWHTKRPTTVRHLLYGERVPSLTEAKEIEAAHLKHCAEKAAARRAEDQELFRAMREAIAAMERTDPEFFSPHIEAARQALLRGGDMADQVGGDD